MVKISLCYTYMEDQSTFREFCGHHHFGQLLQNICVTDDHGYVYFVMDTIPSFYLIVLHLSTNINNSECFFLTARLIYSIKCTMNSYYCYC